MKATKRKGVGGGRNTAKITRKERDHLSEFGEAHPFKDFKLDETTEAIDSSEETVESEETAESSEDGDTDEETPYRRLLGTLKLKGDAGKLYTRRRLEEEGCEEDGDRDESDNETSIGTEDRKDDVLGDSFAGEVCFTI